MRFLCNFLNGESQVVYGRNKGAQRGFLAADILNTSLQKMN